MYHRIFTDLTSFFSDWIVIVISDLHFQLCCLSWEHKLTTVAVERLDVISVASGFVTRD